MTDGEGEGAEEEEERRRKGGGRRWKKRGKVVAEDDGKLKNTVGLVVSPLPLGV